LWATVLFNLFLSLALVRKINALPQDHMSMPEMLEVGTEAPDFAVETLSGDVVKRENLNGNEIAMVFVGPGCSACKDHMPKLQELHPKAQKAGVELMVISISDAEQTGTYVQGLDYTAPIYTAPRDSNSLSIDFKVPGTPSYYVIDHQGKIKASGFFDSSWEKLTQEWSR
jgi:peroxiredoxin